ncbi:DUF551 domain-containing protein [Citrobacter koseri]|uniref:DUF551 domain-containing protein n=1 Tax=Citrobacter koseri TaxID=545 RepID=UPI000DD026C6|nr:DUF551 domain-containing protein [Citrobacter koseri]STB47770.1 Protein of uncharacterised function (DUF551) [Citrobacter koseri]
MKTIQLSERELSIVYSLMAPPYRAEDIRSDEFNELRNKVFYALRDAQNDEPVSQSYKLPVGWVACSERLPPEGYEPDGGAVCYLVWQKNEVDCGPQYSISNVVFLRKHWEKNFTHWMPLPAAPQQEVK